jgi:hypothetical protein
MRAGEDVCLVTARFERRAEEGDRRSFSVGAGDVEDGRQPVLRPPEAVENGSDSLEAETVAGGRQLRQTIELLLDAGVGGSGEVRLLLPGWGRWRRAALTEGEERFACGPLHRLRRSPSPDGGGAWGHAASFVSGAR